jgi:hypothetical protein
VSDNESAGGGEMNEAQVRVTLERWLQANTPNEDVMEAWRTLCATLDATRGGTAIPTGAIHEVWTRTGGLAWPRGRETRPALRITPCETFGARGRTWALAADQRGTLLEAAIEDLDSPPSPTLEALSQDPATPRWLLQAIAGLGQRDPVKAAAEASVLARTLAQRAEQVLAQSGALLGQSGTPC